ncbi:MAG: hypothetical protein ACXABY_08305, partial [Candidatus Thorarchaeota archaeon]
KDTDLREVYRQAIASPLLLSKIDSENGKHYILYSSDWVRIILVRRATDTDNTIEVELSLPEKKGAYQSSPRNTLSTMIAHLQYMLDLHDNGFEIEAMDDDILWIAAIQISRDPGLEVFEVLLPPTG